MNFVNIGVLAHVDAGKTSLTERLLFNAGVIDRIGKVDSGSTQTDSLDLERKRGITIQSGVVSFAFDDVQVNVIDTPGHSDFVAEVERSLRVLDGAVLVVSAVEGVQARTRVVMRSLMRLQIPTLMFVNKIDRMGARYDELLESIREKLTPSIAVMSTVTDIGTPLASSLPCSLSDSDIREQLADNSEPFMNAYVLGDVSEHECRNELIRQTKTARIYPVFFGSAITGVGVQDLTHGIVGILAGREMIQDGPLKARVFKIERGPNDEKIAYARVHEGVLHKRDRVSIWRPNGDGAATCLDGRVSAVRVFEHGATVRDGSATAGAIAKLWGLTEVRIGDELGSPYGDDSTALFAPPTLQSLVKPIQPEQRGELFTAMQRLSEQDPFIQASRDERSGSISVKLYGEVQKEVIGATLADTFGIDVEFGDSHTIYVERPIGTGTAYQAFSPSGPNFFWATIGLLVEPAPIGAGVTYDIGKLRGMIPDGFHKAIEESVRETLRRGIYGWEVIDCAVTLTSARFQPPSSSAGQFRDLAALLVAEALLAAKTVVCEPIHRYELDTPTTTVNRVMAALIVDRAAVDNQTSNGRTSRLTGTVPASHVHAIARQLPEMTHGEGTFVTDFENYAPITGPTPLRERTGPNPYDRDEYMLHVFRTMA